MKTHQLPNESGDSTWFEKLNKFQQLETQRQVYFKRKYWPNLPDGEWSKRQGYTYPHILPQNSDTKMVFYPPIADAVLVCLQKEGIALHSEALNLKSSQVSCLNVMFPLKKDLNLAAKVLSPLLPGVQKIFAIEFEYTGYGVTEWFNEPLNGKRGQNRTSIDCAICWIDEKGDNIMTLVEWKYTEESYGTCGGYNSSGNNDKAFCREFDISQKNERCYLVTRHKRRYWEHLEKTGINLTSLEKLKECPFKGPFYQLMRQFELAYFVQNNCNFDRVEICTVRFACNDYLDRLPGSYNLIGTCVQIVWNSLLEDRVPKLRTVLVEDIVKMIRKEGSHEEWASYLNERYGV